ncbi:MAG: sigma 54-interacting transcriptional regulator [Eubacterium sp.]|nr:sigma 54-interacting transcriptional regulator [Eubacterium sp.]
MNYRKVFMTIIELLKNVDNIYRQTNSFTLVSADEKIIYRYSVILGEYEFFDEESPAPEDHLTNWKNKKNAITEAMKSGKMEYVPPEEHDVMKLKKFHSVCCPVRTGDNEVFYFAALMKENFDILTGWDLFRAYARFFESNLQNMREHMKAETQNRLLNAVLSAIPAGCLILDREMTVTYANEKAQQYSGVEMNAMIGVEIMKQIHEKDLLNDVFKNKRAVYDEVVFLQKKGSKNKMQAVRTIVPVVDDEGETIAVLDLLRDMHQVKGLVNKFAGNIAKYTFDDIIYSGKAMQNTIQQAKYIAWNNHPILIESESGTGKELMAQAIHNESTRKNGPFVVLDCSAITKELAESELFGYESGAFTGAEKGGKVGKVELASGGTLFLDEIGEMPLTLQVKLLRLLQSGTFTKVGSTTPVTVDLRIIAATNRNLKKEIELKNFRLDLYYRLNVFSLRLPPLRERKEDIPVLIRSFMKKYQHEFDKKDVTISDAALEVLCNYNWPGNIRELENIIIRALAMCEKEITPDLFGFAGVKSSEKEKTFQSETAAEESWFSADRLKVLLEEHGYNITKTARAAGVSRQTIYKYMNQYGLKNTGQDVRRKELTAENISQALQETEGNRSQAAKLLGISRKTLYVKLSEYGLG